MSLSLGELVAYARLDKTALKRDLNTLPNDVKAPAAKAGAAGGEAAGKSFGSSMVSKAKAFVAPVAAAFAGAAILDFGRDAFAEAQEAQKTGALTAAVIKSTGGAAKITAEQVGDLSTAISNKVGVDDEAIQSGANMLLTFKNIRNELGAGNDIFNQATQATTDLSAAMGKDMKSSALLVGKALNDPIAGMSALGRAGVQFTAEQKEQIKTLVETGHTMDAQKIILGELESQFGGAAESMSTPADKAKVAWKNFQELVGTAVMPAVNKLFALFTRGVVIISRVGQFIRDNSTAFKILGVGVAALTAIMVAHNAVMTVAAAGGLAKWIAQTRVASMVTKAWAAVQWVMNAALSANPIGIVVIALAALAAGLIYAWKHSETFREIVTGAFDAVKNAIVTVWDWIKENWPLLLGILLGPIGAALALIIQHWDAIKAATSAAWAAVKSFVSGAWDGIKALISGALATVKGWISSAWETVKTTTSAAWDGIKTAISTKTGEMITLVAGIPGRILAAIGSLGSLLYQKGKDIIQGLINGIGSMLGSLGDAMGDVLGTILDYLPGSPVKKGPLRALNNGRAGGKITQMVADGMLSERDLVAQAAGIIGQSARIGLTGSLAVGAGSAGGGGDARAMGELVAVLKQLANQPRGGDRHLTYHGPQLSVREIAELGAVQEATDARYGSAA